MREGEVCFSERNIQFLRKKKALVPFVGLTCWLSPDTVLKERWLSAMHLWLEAEKWRRGGGGDCVRLNEGSRDRNRIFLLKDMRDGTSVHIWCLRGKTRGSCQNCEQIWIWSWAFPHFENKIQYMTLKRNNCIAKKDTSIKYIPLNWLTCYGSSQQ